MTWDPTDPRNVSIPADVSLSRNTQTSGEPSRRSIREPRVTDTGTQLDEDEPESYETTGTESYEDDTGGDSIGRFPTFHFSLHRLSSLGALLSAPVTRREKRLACLLVAVLEVDGPTMITTKAGVEMGLLKLIIGDEKGAVAKVVVWRETALQWGGGEDRMGDGAVRKGDVVFLESECYWTSSGKLSY